MEKEQELQEIRRYLWEEVDGYDLTWEPDCDKLAEKLYEDGWRKVTQAEWISAPCSEKDGNATCSACGHWDWSDCNYCSCCGAEMVGRR